MNDRHVHRFVVLFVVSSTVACSGPRVGPPLDKSGTSDTAVPQATWATNSRKSDAAGGTTDGGTSASTDAAGAGTESARATTSNPSGGRESATASGTAVTAVPDRGYGGAAEVGGASGSGGTTSSLDAGTGGVAIETVAVTASTALRGAAGSASADTKTEPGGSAGAGHTQSGGATSVESAGSGGTGARMTATSTNTSTSTGTTTSTACTEPTNWVPLKPEVIAGFDADGAPLSACVAPYGDGKHPGEYRFARPDVCTVGWGGAARDVDASTSFQGLQLAWAKCGADAIPAHALQFGEEPNRNPIYPCRAIVGGQQRLGRISAGQNACLVADAGVERAIPIDYEVLINDAAKHFPIRVRASVPRQPPPMEALTGVPLGTDPSDAEYLCRARWKGGLYPGRIHSGETACNITYLGESLSVDTYDVLVPSFMLHHPGDTTVWAAGNEANGEKLGLCRVKLSSGAHVIGKYLYPKDACNLPIDAAEVQWLSDQDFEVLRGSDDVWGPNIQYFYDALIRNAVTVCFNGAFTWDLDVVDGQPIGRTVNGVRQGSWTADTSDYTQEIAWFKSAMSRWSLSTGAAIQYVEICPQPIPLGHVPIIFTNVDSLRAMGGWSQIGIGGRFPDLDRFGGADREYQMGLAVFKGDPLTERQFTAIAVHEMGRVLGLQQDPAVTDPTADPLYACGADQPTAPASPFAVGNDPDSILNACRDRNRDGIADIYTADISDYLTPLDKAIGQMVYGFPAPWVAANKHFCAGGKMYTGKFNADDRTDILCLPSGTMPILLDFAEISGVFEGIDWVGPAPWCAEDGDRLVIGDVNGDDRDDLVCENYTNGNITIAQAEPDGTFPTVTWSGTLPYCNAPNSRLLMGKFNDDPRADIACHDLESHQFVVDLANEQGQFGDIDWPWSGDWCNSANSRLVARDVNGDGLDDMICENIDAGSVVVDLARTNGSFPADDAHGPDGYCKGPSQRSLFADVDGNAMVDMLCHDPATGSLRIAFGTSTGAFTDVKLTGPFARFCRTRGDSTGTLYVGRYSGGIYDEILCNYQTGSDASTMEIQFSKMPQIY